MLAICSQIKPSPEELKQMQRSVASRVSSALTRGSAGGEVTDAEANLLMQAVGDLSDLSEPSIEEAQAGPGVGQTDEEEFAGISKDQKEAISKLKLSKAEMKNLVPKVSHAFFIMK